MGGWEIFTRNGGAGFIMGGWEISKVSLHSWQSPPPLFKKTHTPPRGNKRVGANTHPYPTKFCQPPFLVTSNPHPSVLLVVLLL